MSKLTTFLTKKADLGEGAIMPTLLRMSVPAVAMMLLNTFVHLVDTVFVSWLGEDPMVAISITFPTWIALFAMLEGVGGGTTALVGRFLGQGKKHHAQSTAVAGLAMGYAVCLLTLPLLHTGVSESILNQLGASKSVDILRHGYSYNFWMPFIAPLITYTYISNCIFRCQGDSVTPLVCMAIANVVNVLLDPLFIFVFKMGIGGAGAATFVGRLCGVLYVYWQMQKNKDFSLSAFFWPKKYFLTYWKLIFSVGFPVTLSTASVAFGFGAISKLLSTYGTSVVAGWMIGIRVEDFYFMIAMGVGAALTPFIAYNYGQRNIERMKQGIWAAMLICTVLMTFMGALIVLFPHPFVALFRPTPAAAEVAVRSMRINIVGYLFIIIQFILGAFFVGTGHSFYGTAAQVTRTIIVRIPAAFFFASLGGASLVWWFQPFSWMIGASLAMVFSLFIFRKMKRDFAHSPALHKADE